MEKTENLDIISSMCLLNANALACREGCRNLRDQLLHQTFTLNIINYHHQYLRIYKSERQNCIKCYELCCNIITKSSSIFKLELKFNFSTFKLFIFIIYLFVKKKAESSVVGHSRRRIRFNCKMSKSGIMFVYYLQLQ